MRPEREWDRPLEILELEWDLTIDSLPPVEEVCFPILSDDLQTYNHIHVVKYDIKAYKGHLLESIPNLGETIPVPAQELPTYMYTHMSMYEHTKGRATEVASLGRLKSSFVLEEFTLQQSIPFGHYIFQVQKWIKTCNTSIVELATVSTVSIAWSLLQSVQLVSRGACYRMLCCKVNYLSLSLSPPLPSQQASDVSEEPVITTTKCQRCKGSFRQMVQNGGTASSIQV